MDTSCSQRWCIVNNDTLRDDLHPSFGMETGQTAAGNFGLICITIYVFGMKIPPLYELYEFIWDFFFKTHIAN